MSMPAGWYDDGSGRQRWWDGARWTDDYAPSHGADVAPHAAATTTSAPAPDAQVTSAPPARVSPILGFVGLGLAVLGTVLACIPATFGIGAFVLLAAFVVSLIGLFTKGAAKWPSIVGMILAVIGGVIGAIVLVVGMILTAAGPVGPVGPTGTPSSEQPTDPPTSDTSDERPSTDELAETVLADLQRSGIHQYDDDPEWVACWAQYVYDSDLSDDALQEYVDTMDVLGEERELMGSVSADATVSCSTQ